MDPGGPDAGVGPPDVALGPAEHLDVTGIQIDRRVAQHQRSAHRCWPHGQPPPVHPAQSGLDPRHPVRGEPPSDRRGGRARRHRRGRQQRTPRVGPDPGVQPGQAVLPSQLRRRHPHQQLAAAHAPVTLLHRPDPGVQRPDHVQPDDQLLHPRQPRQPGHRSFRGPVRTRHGAPQTRLARRLLRRNLLTRKVSFHLNGVGLDNHAAPSRPTCGSRSERPPL